MKETKKVAVCNLCFHEFPIDEVIANRKKNHEAKHKRDPYRNLSRESGGGNNTIGIVIWTEKETQ
jgi:hypothetical protein